MGVVLGMSMKRILVVLLAALLSVGCAAETVKGLGKPRGYVNDYAGVLDEPTRRGLETRCRALHDETTAQIAVVTIHRLEGGETAQHFTHELQETWGVGSKGTDLGVVMLFSIDDHKRWIEVGYGLEGALNDAKVGDIGRTMVPLLKQSRYGPAIEVGFEQVESAIRTELGKPRAVTPPDEVAADSPVVEVPVAAETGHSLWYTAFRLLPLLWVFVILGWIVYQVRRRRGPRRGSGGIGWGATAGTDNTPSRSDFSSESGSSSSDSSSSSSSSSDSSFDGGSSGGGGAGGDW